MYKKVNFTGNFWEYIFIGILLLIGSIVTFGLLLPYFVYWNVEYFFTHMEIDGHALRFTGNFWEYFFVSIGLIILSAVTFGIALPYYLWWSVKYFFDKLEVPDFN